QATRTEVTAAIKAAQKTEKRGHTSTSGSIVCSVSNTMYFVRWGNIHMTALNVQCALRDRAPKNRGLEAMNAEQVPQCELVRDIVGNPDRPMTVEKSWLTSDVKALARAIYEERTLPAGTLDPIRLAILADALEEAGCTNRTVLDHCRDAD